MSKPKNIWWNYARNMIRVYPDRKREYDALHEQSLAINMSGMPGGGGVSRPLENIAIRELPGVKQREYESVRRAIEETRRFKNGEHRMKIIDLMYWKNSHTMAGAGQKVGYSYDRASQIHRDFVRMVAKNYGLLDKDYENEP